MSSRDKNHRQAIQAGSISQRQLRVGEELRHLLAMIFARESFRDPELVNQSLTFTEVRISPDLKNATVFFVAFGQSAQSSEAKTVETALNRSSPFVRGILAKELLLRTVPKLVFTLDQSFDHASKINQLLNMPKVAQDLE